MEVKKWMLNLYMLLAAVIIIIVGKDAISYLLAAFMYVAGIFHAIIRLRYLKDGNKSETKPV